MPPRNKPADLSPTTPPRLHWLRFTFWLVGGVFLMVGTLFAWHSTEEFLIKDERFRLAEPQEFAGHSPNLTVEGIHYASTSQVRHVFAEDFGRSLYLVPVQTRRKDLLALDWVEDASVSKIWPNTLKVKVRERLPVAFVRLSTKPVHDASSRLALIDKDGHILRPRVPAQFTLPVIAGIRESESTADRRARVHRVLELIKDIGPLAGDVSEIDVSDPNNLIIAEHVSSVVLNLMLGEENFNERLQNFLNNYPAIREKRPDVKTLDLRVDGIITAVGENHGGE